MLAPILQTLEALTPNAPARKTRSPLARAAKALDSAERLERALAIAALACLDCQFKSRKGCTLKHMSARITRWSQAAAARGEPEAWLVFDVAHCARGLSKLIHANLDRLSLCGLGIRAVPREELRDAKLRFRSCGELRLPQGI